MSIYNVSLVGCGAILESHIESLKRISNVRIHSLIDIDVERARLRAVELGCSYYKGYEEILDNKDIDVVHILTPHHKHYEMAMELAKRGKHILVEKPLCESYTRAKNLCKELKDIGVVKGVVYQNRFNPTTLKVKEIIEDGRYGNLLGLKGILTWNREDEYYKESPWRGRKKLEGGGLFINQGIHTIDLLQWLGGKVDRVSGSYMTHRDSIDVEDSGEIKIEFSSGSRGIFYGTNNYTTNSSIELEAHLERATLNIKNGVLIIYGEDQVEVVKDDNCSYKNYYGNGHLELIRNFYLEIEGKKNMYVSMEESLGALKILDSIYKGGKR